MAWRFLVLLSTFSLACSAQVISTSTPIPPLQWLNLTALLSGPAPPPLRDASIGYDETSRSLIVFGGESAAGFAQSSTYLLNLDSLTWYSPSPPANLPQLPPPRSAAIAGDDFAANYRRGFVVAGGKGSGGVALSDVWEYDYNNQFWAEINISASASAPSPRWGASGGIDFRTLPTPNPTLSYPNNTFYLAGGVNGTSTSPLSDIWMLNISGTLSSNNPTSVTASWQSLSVSDLPAKSGQASAVISQQIVVVGGCDTTPFPNNSCAQPDSYVINLQSRTDISPTHCPAPRLGAALVSNTNAASSSFANQVFLVLGTFDSSSWNDSGGLEAGEVAVLDIESGSWSRVLPAGDPGVSSGAPAFPTPRGGAAAFSYTSALVGDSRSTASDTIIFGGQDALGNYLSEIWLLRAYNGVLTSSNASWSGYGDGVLETGLSASGSGVTIQFMPMCASPISSPASSSSRPSSTSSSEPTPAPSNSISTQLFGTALAHKVLAPLSIAFLLPAVLLSRLTSSYFYSDATAKASHPLLRVSYILAVFAYGVGVAGLATSFQSSRRTTSSAKRSLPAHFLSSNHGRAGFALFIGFYGLCPLLFIFNVLYQRGSINWVGIRGKEVDTAPEEPVEKAPPFSPDDGSPRSSRRQSPSHSPALSWVPWRRSFPPEEFHPSSDAESIHSSGLRGGFEVTNRPSHGHRVASTWLTVRSAESSDSHRMPRNLADIDWLERRRSLNAVGELDYAVTQAQRASNAPMLGTMDNLISMPKAPQIRLPRLLEIVIRFIFHALLLALCIFTLIALWLFELRSAFAVFLVWTVTIYTLILLGAWRGRPQISFLSVAMARLRLQSDVPEEAATNPPPSDQGQHTISRGPYVYHQPPFHSVLPSGYDHWPRSVESNDGEGEDEDITQERIESEMNRRDVSIITVPKRKLRIANPS